MAYRAQLVVRTSNPIHAKTIDRIKELADGSSQTISDIALDLLQLGLKVRDGDATLTTSDVEASDDEERSEGHVRSPEATAKPAPRPKVKPAPPGGPDEEPGVVAERAVEVLETDGPKAAAEVVATFFAAAGAVDGGKVRAELQDRLTIDDFEQIFEALKVMEAYREYRQRVLYG